MATNQSPPRPPESGGSKSGTGIAHLTVVPANYDPESADDRRE